MKAVRWFTLLLAGLSQTWAIADVPARLLSLSEAMSQGERTSPDLQASAARESQARESIRIAQSYLYPALDLSAVDSFGFPGSTSPIPPQLGGMITSPYRVGPAGELLARVSLIDVRNWHEATAASENAKAVEVQTQIARMRVDQAILSAYLEAAKLRGEMEVWASIVKKVEAVEQVVQRQVRNGQASEVAKLLMEDQGDESKMNQQVSEERYKQALKRLTLLTGLSEQEFDCPPAGSLTEKDLSFLVTGSKSPLIAQVEAEMKVAQANASKASAEPLPKVYAAASAALMSNSRFVEKENFSAWIGATVPLFEGHRLSSEAQRAQFVLDEESSRLAATRLQLDTENARLDEAISASRLQLMLLRKQHESGIRAYDLARRRYLSFLEPIIHLRESIRNLARIETQTNDVTAKLLIAAGSQALLNGARATH